MNNSKTKPAVAVEPKKSARLAHKRKLREEAGPSLADDDFYFSPYSYGKSSTSGYGKSSSQSSQSSPSVSPMKSEGSKVKQQKSSPTAFKGHTFDAKSMHNHRDASNVSECSKSPSPNFLLDCFEDETEKKFVVGSRSSSSLGNTSGTKKGTIQTNSSAVTSDFSTLKLKEDDESLEEEKWLDALEAGKLEDLDEELRQIKNPTVLTARQRAILEKRDKNFVLFDEPDDSTNSSKVMTEEMIQLKAAKTEKRRILAQAKKESEQKKTVEKLLNKPYTKGGRNAVKNKGPRKPTGPVITFINRVNENYVVFPPSMAIPFSEVKPPKSPPKVIICGVAGCNNLKKYRCPKTDTPLCSLECYKKNLNFSLFSDPDSFGCESTMCDDIVEYTTLQNVSPELLASLMPSDMVDPETISNSF